MKKYLMLLVMLMLTPTFNQAQEFNLEGQNKFKVQAGHYYEFEIPLRGNTQYFFKLTGDGIFNFRIVEPSGNPWRLHISDNNEIMLMENIMDKGVYKIKVYSIARNTIKMVWGEY